MGLFAKIVAAQEPLSGFVDVAKARGELAAAVKEADDKIAAARLNLTSLVNEAGRQHHWGRGCSYYGDRNQPYGGRGIFRLITLSYVLQRIHNLHETKTNLQRLADYHYRFKPVFGWFGWHQIQLLSPETINNALLGIRDKLDETKKLLESVLDGTFSDKQAQNFALAPGYGYGAEVDFDCPPEFASASDL